MLQENVQNRSNPWEYTGGSNFGGTPDPIPVIFLSELSGAQTGNWKSKHPENCQKQEDENQELQHGVPEIRFRWSSEQKSRWPYPYKHGRTGNRLCTENSNLKSLEPGTW